MHTELLFAYGTLQIASVQLSTFGRKLVGAEDALARFELVPLDIEDEKVIAVSGKAQHTMATFTGRDSDVVPGVVFAISAGELQSADAYEVPAVRRIAVVLESGTRAWTYVDSNCTPPHS